MREVLYEESINPTNLNLRKAFYIVYRVFKIVNIVLAVIVGYLGLLYFNVPTLILGLLFVSSAVLLAFLQGKVYYCVDCIFVSGSTRIIKVVNYKKRRKILIFEYTEVEQIGRVGSASFDKIYLDKTVKKVYATPNKYFERGFYISLKQDGVKYLVMMDCKEEYLINLVQFTGRRVIEKDYGNDISR